jgi:hypothetical protein
MTHVNPLFLHESVQAMSGCRRPLYRYVAPLLGLGAEVPGPDRVKAVLPLHFTNIQVTGQRFQKLNYLSH